VKNATSALPCANSSSKRACTNQPSHHPNATVSRPHQIVNNQVSIVNCPVHGLTAYFLQNPLVTVFHPAGAG
jgi:hypothetical protein